MKFKGASLLLAAALLCTSLASCAPGTPPTDDSQRQVAYAQAPAGEAPAETLADPDADEQPAEAVADPAATRTKNVVQVKQEDVLFYTEDQAREILSDIQERDYYLDMTTADTLYWVKPDNYSRADQMLAGSIQGIVAQTEAEIFLRYDAAEPWFHVLQEDYGITMIEVDSVWDLVDMFKDHLNEKGYVRYHVYDEKENDYNLEHPEAEQSSNVASMISGLNKYLMIDDSQIQTAEKHGLVQKADALEYYFLEDAIDDMLDDLNHRMMCSYEPHQTNLRDMIIAGKMVCWDGTDTEILTDYLTQLGKSGVVIGWHRSEGAGVQATSMAGWTTVASSYLPNMTVYVGLPKVQPAPKPNAKFEDKTSDKVHYVTFMFSDGDNIQFVGNMIEHLDRFGSLDRGAIPFGWTMSPTLAEFGSLMPAELYERATIFDEFVASVSGFGYMYPNHFPEEQLVEMVSRANDCMGDLNLHYLQIMERSSGNPDWDSMRKWYQVYADQSNIWGAFVFPYYNAYLYRKEHGGVLWMNDKPFVTIRETLWLEQGLNPTADKNEGLSRMAYRLNHYTRDSSVIEGYTAVNVNCWTYNYTDVVDLVSMLDDDVIVVTPSEFMELIAKNVKHEDKLVLDDPDSFDYTDMELFKNASISVEDLEVSDRTSFDFSDGTQGWKLLAGSRNLDLVRLQNYTYTPEGAEESITRQALYMSGSLYGTESDVANGKAYNKLQIPVGATKLQIGYRATGAKMRLKQITEDGTEIVLTDYMDFKAGNTVIYYQNFDISSFAGQTVVLCLEFIDGSPTLSGTSVTICDINII